MTSTTELRAQVGNVGPLVVWGTDSIFVRSTQKGEAGDLHLEFSPPISDDERIALLSWLQNAFRNPFKASSLQFSVLTGVGAPQSYSINSGAMMSVDTL